nr:MAG: replication associated protein [Cressdnaviricota sp.]
MSDSEEDGPKTKNPKVKTWVFTLNNYTEDDIKTVKSWECNKIACSLEVGESGTPHIQGAIVFKASQRLKALKKLHPKMHWLPAKYKHDFNYIRKAGSVIIRDEDNTKQGNRTDLEDFCNDIKAKKRMRDIAYEHPEVYVKYHQGLEKLNELLNFTNRSEPPKVIWLYGLSGTGKTRYPYDRHPAEDIHKQDHINWWDGYRQQPVVLVDEILNDEYKLRWDFATFKSLLDRYPTRVQRKGNFPPFNSPTIYLTCEYHPNQIWAGNQLVEIERRLTEIIHCEFNQE